MLSLSCPNCGSKLDTTPGTQKCHCSFCDSIFILQDGERSLSEIKKEDVYIEACRLMGADNIFSLNQAAGLFSAISSWKDAESKSQECKERADKIQQQLDKENEIRRIVERKRRKRKRIIALTLLFITIGVVAAYSFTRARNHSYRGVDVSIKDASSQSDSYYAYVYFDYEITNHTGASIDYVKVTTRFVDEKGKSLGTVSSEFGTPYKYGGVPLSLKAHDSTIEETYLQESLQSMSKLFGSLYYEGVDNLIISYEITEIRWTDGVTYKR